MIWSRIYDYFFICLLLLMLVGCEYEPQIGIATATATEVPTEVALAPTSTTTLPPTKEATAVAPTSTKEPSVSGFSLSEWPIEVRLPQEPGYLVSEQEGPESALASYRLQSVAGCDTVCLQEINVFSLATCSADFCAEYTPWSVNEQQERHPAGNRVHKMIDQGEGCENGSCVLGEYVTYLGNIVVSTQLKVNDESQMGLADELFAQLNFQATDLAPLFDTQESLLEWVKAAWATNTDPVAVQAALLSTDWIKDESDLQALDLDGDGREEWLITLIDDMCCFDKGLSPSSVWLVDDGKIIFNQPSQPRMVNRILYVSDITGDQLPDVVVESATYGANYYPLKYHVLSAHDGTIRSIVQPPPEVRQSYSFDDGNFISMGVDHWEEVQLLDVTGDGLHDLILNGIAGGGAGGGVSPPFRAVWSWDGQAISLADVTWQETKYRFHTLYNANHAFEKGDEQTAHLLYSRVIFNELLTDEVSASCTFDQNTDTCKRDIWAPVQDVYASNRQFAAFRLILLALGALDREPETTFLLDEATFWRDWLQKQYPDAPLTEGSRLLLNEWDATKQLETACAAVNGLLTSRWQATGPLADMGYNNPQLTPETVCVPAQAPEPRQVREPEQAQTIEGPEGELEDQILIKLLQATPKEGYLPTNEKVNVLPLDVRNKGDQQAPLWVAFTNGSITDYPALEHFLAIYTRQDEQWQELAYLSFNEPNYIDDSSVRQVQVDSADLWLEVFGGVGVSSNQYKLLRYIDGGQEGEGSHQLNVEMDHLGSIHVGDRLTPIDLDQDGALELVLTPVENYVFCIDQCEVRYYQFKVLRWDGNTFTEVALTSLPESAPPELRDLNNRAVELAQADLWKDALSTIRQAQAIDHKQSNQNVTWNAILINLHAEAKFKHTFDQGDKQYPLLANVLYGDYQKALEMMRPYPVEQIFSPQSAIISGTIAAQWKPELNHWMSKAVENALTAQPDLAAAYFLRGWSTYLVDPNNPQLLFDIERAAALAPEERLYQQSLTYLTSR